MLETAIIGAGLCGVALARSLHRRGEKAALFEARSRLGGRILSTACAKSGMAVDLGPTWFWPDTQPLITRLIADLDLVDFDQHDEGAVLHLRDPDKSAEGSHIVGVHGGARRLDGGMGRLIKALAADLPRHLLYFDHELTGVSDRGDHVALAFRVGEGSVEFCARRVVLAIPPRLLEQQVRFEPALDAATREAMRNAPTWMAAQAKVVIGYDQPLWRRAGQSGNAFVTHAQAVIGEIFDACDMTSKQAALGGFLALSPEQRDSFSIGLPMLMASQMTQVFGPALDAGAQTYQDWATERFTCSALDRVMPQAEHSSFASPLLRRPLWGGKLHLGGSETARRGAGYLEGALEAARRIDRELRRLTASRQDTAPGAQMAAASWSAESLNAASLLQFGGWVANQRDVAFDLYRQFLTAGLVAQERSQLTQRAVLRAVEEIYRRALDVLGGLEFDLRGVAVERGRSAPTPKVQEPFRDFLQSIIDDVIGFNRTSCALSNFPDEHHLSEDYVQTILRDIAAAWREFSLSLNHLLLAKAERIAAGGGGMPAQTGVSP